MTTQQLYKSKNVHVFETDEYKIRRLDNGDLAIPVKGFIFTNTDDRDLEDDFFDIEGDRGPLTKVLSYFDHQMSEHYIPRETQDGKSIEGFGRRRVGHANKLLTEEEHELWEIIVDHRHRYINLIEELAVEGHLGASSIAFHREDDPDVKGRIAIWDTIAMDLTPTPAEPRAQVIVKKHLMQMFEEITTEIVEDEKEEGMPTLEDNIKKAFDDADNDEEEIEEAEESTDTEKTEESAKEDHDDPTNDDIIGADIGNDIKALLQGMNEHLVRIDDRTKSIEGEVKDIQDAFPVLATETAKYVGSMVRDIAKQTTDEFEAESEIIRLNKSKQKSQKRRKGTSLYANKMTANAPGAN